MRQFVKIETCEKDIRSGSEKRRVRCVYPSYSASGKDIMKKGGKFYAVLNRETGMWSVEENAAILMIDNEVNNYIKNHYTLGNDGKYHDEQGLTVYPELLDNSKTNRLKEFNIWMQNIPENHNYVPLDGELTFMNDKVTPEMYRSKRLDYDVKEGDLQSYDRLMSVLYSEEDRQKIEWFIGSVYTGASKKIEKMLVFYGKPGSGKSTVLDIIKALFKSYWSPFVASEIVNRSYQFATAAFKDNPLVAIQDDGTMDKIDSPVINELVSHKDVMINEKRKSQYSIKFNGVLILATNDPVDIRNRGKGIARRLLDVYPSGKRISEEEFDSLVSRIGFEYGAIADRCIKVFKSLGKNYYSKYVPEQMIQRTNPLQNYLFERYDELVKRESWARSELYGRFKTYCEDNGLSKPPSASEFGEQLKLYFSEYQTFKRDSNGRSLHYVYSGLKPEMVLGMNLGLSESTDILEKNKPWLEFNGVKSQLDISYPDAPAQYASKEGSPICKWSDCTTLLRDIDTSKLHWFKLPGEVIKVDFDLKDKDGNKSLMENVKAANKFPETYAEVSKSGCGIHLYYIYDGDTSKLSRIYEEGIEVKLSTGNNSHRRILTKFNDIPIAHISTGLPLKTEKPKVDDIPITVNGLKTTIRRCLAKEIHGDTRSNIDWIFEILERAYSSGIKYDLTYMENDILEFAKNSTNQSEYCVRKVSDMHFRSKEPSNYISEKGDRNVIDENVASFEKDLRKRILDILNDKSIERKSALELVAETIDAAYESGMSFDISDLHQDLLIFAIDSKDVNESGKLMDLVGTMHFVSAEEGSYVDEYDPDGPLIFFDYEVFPNLVLLCWKYEGENQPVMTWFNPTPEQIGEFLGMGRDKKPKNIGFNNKDYDDHISYAIWLGKTTYEVYLISQGIINKEKNAKFREARKLSYADVFDFLPEKISLKKWEIRLKLPHKENPIPWDKPVDEKFWPMIAEYCKNDVLATEAVFKANEAAWKARHILVDLANNLIGPGSHLIDSTNQLTTRLIVGDERNPQQYFVYPDLSEEFPGYEYCATGIDKSRYISKDVIISGKSFYKGYDPGEGGFVWAKPGMYGYSESDDSASHHPSTIRAKNGFGKFTVNFNRLLDIRIMVKHKEYEKLKAEYPFLEKYLTSDQDAADLSYALKIAINSVYGLTAAKFKHPLHDPRNIDNWVAKRGALFMIDLMLNVQQMGYTVIHCKTDSIKVLNPDDKIRNYIYEFGKKYGYTFEVEHRFERLCLVNDAVYVCKYTDEDVNGKLKGKWDATGKQFQVPYVFKILFSHENIEFEDMCEAKNCSTALYLDLNEDMPEGEHNYNFIGKTGLFCPIKPNCGGGSLYRIDQNGKYAAAESTKGYLWLEADSVKTLGKEKDINEDYYISQVNKAVDTLAKFGDVEQFLSDAPYVDMNFMNIPEIDEEEIPFN